MAEIPWQMTGLQGVLASLEETAEGHRNPLSPPLSGPTGGGGAQPWSGSLTGKGETRFLATGRRIRHDPTRRPLAGRQLPSVGETGPRPAGKNERFAP